MSFCLFYVVLFYFFKMYCFINNSFHRLCIKSTTKCFFSLNFNKKITETLRNYYNLPEETKNLRKL